MTQNGSSMLDSIFQLISIVLDFFGSMYNLMFEDLWTLMRNVEFPLLQELLNAIQWIGLDVLFTNISLIGLCFSVGVILVIIVKFFIT